MDTRQGVLQFSRIKFEGISPCDRSIEMSQFIQISKHSLHVPSISNARLMPSVFLRRPWIYMNLHSGHSFDILYWPGEWSQARKDFERLQQSMKVCQNALNQVNLIEALPEKKVQPQVQSTYPVCVNPPYQQPVKLDNRSPPSIA